MKLATGSTPPPGKESATVTSSATCCLRQHENALKNARREFADAADQLLLFLPDGVPLRYSYEGEGSDLFGAEYVIVRKQGEIVIESPSKTTRMFLKQAFPLRYVLQRLAS